MRKIGFKITKRIYIKGFFVVVLALALTRIIFPSIAGGRYTDQDYDDKELANGTASDTLTDSEIRKDSARIVAMSDIAAQQSSVFYNGEGIEKKNRVRGVRDYDESFPDSNDVQLQAAYSLGVPPVANRAEAERRLKELVFIGSNPYYDVRKLNSSIPYLVPRAAVLLQDIACNFMDSLQTKNIPLSKIIISSVLRTREDVDNLRKRNHNATENSCHLYGTTFDIAYNHYVPITREVRNDTLKWVLSEVLNDLRKNGRCYIKHEKRQGCFHITTR